MRELLTVAILTLCMTAAQAQAYAAEPHATRVVSVVDRIYAPNRSFDWRHTRTGWQIPWYAYSESRHCFVWTPDAYHFACDPNARY